ncbi:hypothetical protein K438DRAFT_1775960 [Mycena galopus ATCC 62051]|nr:hypothetical protein K438DRAFT_1775960 [Mycena galopus ATCC 62051]
MAPKPWATAEQELWLLNWMPDFIKRQAEGKLHLFWPPMQEGWFQRYPEEKDLKLPLPTDQDKRALTSEEVLKLGAAILVRKGQLENWFRNHRKKIGTADANIAPSSAAAIVQCILQQGLGVAKRRCAHQPIEIFQKRNPEAIKEALVEAGTPAARLKRTKSDRMRLRTRVVQGLWAKASPEEHAVIAVELEAEKNKLHEEELRRELSPDEMMPEQRQQGINPLEAVFTEMHKAAYLATGWVSMSIFGGRNPRMNGDLTLKIVCFSETAAGNDFEACCVDFNAKIIQPFQDFLRLCFSNRDSTTWVLPATLDMVADDRPIEHLITPPTPPATKKLKPSKKSGSKSKKSKSKSKQKASAIVEKAGSTLPASDTEEDSELDTWYVFLLLASIHAKVSPWDRAESPEWEALDDEASGGAASLHDEAAPLRNELGDATPPHDDSISDDVTPLPPSQIWPVGMTAPLSPTEAGTLATREGGINPSTMAIDPMLQELSYTPTPSMSPPPSQCPLPRPMSKFALAGELDLTTACHRGRAISAQYYRNTRQRQDRVPFSRVIYDNAHRPRSPSFASASDTLPTREAPVAHGPTAAGVAPASVPRAACKGAGKAAVYPNVQSS